MSKLQHMIQRTNLRESVGHYFLFNLEKYIEDNNLKYYKDLKSLYKVKNLEEVQKILSKFGKVVYTAIGMYVEIENAIILMDVSVDDEDSGLYVHLEFFFNEYFDIKVKEEYFTKELEEFECKETITRVLWQFKTKEYIDSVSIYEVNTTEVHDESYPYIKEGLDNYIQRFMDSDETVLVMVGPAGTGKTKLIKYIMKYMANKIEKVAKLMNGDILADDRFIRKIFSVAYSTSQETYNDDEFFIDFVKSDNKLLILEDIDYNLRARTDGNTFMHKLLNASDGIVELKRKKIIITTNLENEQKTDKALLRPGRTFDVLKTRHLNKEEAQILAAKLGKEFNLNKADGKYSLAEIYNCREEKSYTMSFY